MAFLTGLVLALTAAITAAQFEAPHGNHPWHHPAGNWSSHRGNWTGRHQWTAGGPPHRPFHQRPRPGQAQAAGTDSPSAEPQEAFPNQLPPFVPLSAFPSADKPSENQPSPDSFMSIMPFPMPEFPHASFPLPADNADEAAPPPPPEAALDIFPISSPFMQGDPPVSTDDRTVFHTEVMPDTPAQNTGIVPPASLVQGRQVRIRLPSRANVMEGLPIPAMQEAPSSSSDASPPSSSGDQGNLHVIHLQARPQQRPDQPAQQRPDQPAQPPAHQQQNDGHGPLNSVKLPARHIAASSPSNPPSAPQPHVHLNPRQGSASSPSPVAPDSGKLRPVQLPSRNTAPKSPAAQRPPPLGPLHSVQLKPRGPRPQPAGPADAPRQEPINVPATSADAQASSSGQTNGQAPLHSVHLGARGQYFNHNGNPADLG